MTMPSQTVMLRVDYGDADYRESLPGGPANRRDIGNMGYADLTHVGSEMRVTFDGQYEIQTSPAGARIIAAALVAFADMLEPSK